MRVILTDDVVGVGDIGETVRVKPGFGRNFLIPRGLAIESESISAREISHRMKQIDAKKKRLRLEAEGEAARMAMAAIELELRVGTGGKVFGSIGTRDIADKLKEQGFDIDRRRVILHEPLRKPGVHGVKIKLHAEVIAEVKVTVKAVAASKEQEEEETEQAKQKMEETAAAKEEQEPEAPVEEGAAEPS